jgi:hypothetical protein
LFLIREYVAKEVFSLYKNFLEATSLPGFEKVYYLPIIHLHVAFPSFLCLLFFLVYSLRLFQRKGRVWIPFLENSSTKKDKKCEGTKKRGSLIGIEPGTLGWKGRLNH